MMSLIVVLVMVRDADLCGWLGRLRYDDNDNLFDLTDQLSERVFCIEPRNSVNH